PVVHARYSAEPDAEQLVGRVHHLVRCHERRAEALAAWRPHDSPAVVNSLASSVNIPRRIFHTRRAHGRCSAPPLVCGGRGRRCGPPLSFRALPAVPAVPRMRQTVCPWASVPLSMRRPFFVITSRGF